MRRRLFQPMDAPLYPARDAVARAFGDMYRAQSAEFPPGCGESDYERRIKAAYPFHPELFDRLNDDWGSLDRFQRTRGVLRLMAAVIHELWERDDRSLLIMPSSIPLDEQTVQNELTRYIEDPWRVVIETDVDGPHSLPLRIDRDNPNLGPLLGFAARGPHAVHGLGAHGERGAQGPRRPAHQARLRAARRERRDLRRRAANI